jgi:hypothetical protein
MVIVQVGDDDVLDSVVDAEMAEQVGRIGLDLTRLPTAALAGVDATGLPPIVRWPARRAGSPPRRNNHRKSASADRVIHSQACARQMGVFDGMHS